jgi:EAL domain-containing protein (putative c-di-GMP-specific phosphodiesterase class I)
MTARIVFLGAILFFCACVTIGSVVFLISGGGLNSSIASLLALANTIAVLCAVLMAVFNTGDIRRIRQTVRSDFAGLDRRVREESSRRDTFLRDLDELRVSSSRNAQTISAGFAEIRGSYTSLAEQLRTTISTVSNFQSARTFAAQQGFSRTSEIADAGEPISLSSAPQLSQTAIPSSHPETKESSQLFSNSMSYASFEPPEPSKASRSVDQLVISLEPVIDLFTAKTTHYRLHLSMANPNGQETGQDVLLHHADRTGLRPEFDVHAAQEALKLLYRLRQRDSELHIFLSIGASTLQSATAVQDLIDIASDYPDVSRGLVLELTHAMLAGLSDAGLEGLAELARSGVKLAISNLSINGIDLGPLETLNVKFFTIAATAVGGVAGPSPELVNFARAARAAQIQIIVTGIVDRRVIMSLTQISRYVSGPVFAEPRRVRANVTQAGSKNTGLGAAA